MSNRVGMIFIICLCFLHPFNATLSNEPIQFSTKPGLGFDKQISIWLVEKYITPQNKVIFFSDDRVPENTQLFDESSAVFMRTANKSTFELLVDHYKLEASSFKHLNKLTFDIEINLWMPDELQDSIAVEKAYRDLQEKWGRTNVPHQCYTEFFNAVERTIIKKLALNDIGNQTKNLACWKDALHQTVTSPEMIVPTISISTLLGHMNAGAKAVFIDVREPDEFAENHIPGAINKRCQSRDHFRIKKL